MCDCSGSTVQHAGMHEKNIRKYTRIYVHMYVYCMYVCTYICMYALVHKQMYWIRTNPQRFQPLNIFEC